MYRVEIVKFELSAANKPFSAILLSRFRQGEEALCEQAAIRYGEGYVTDRTVQLNLEL